MHVDNGNILISQNATVFWTLFFINKMVRDNGGK